MHRATALPPLLSCCLALCVAGGTTPTHAFELQDLQAPPGVRLSWVGKRIVQNGMPMQIVQLQSHQPVAEVLRFYREDWRHYHKPGERATVTNTSGDWQILSTLVDEHNVVVQLRREAGQTVGFLSSTPLDTPTRQNAIARHFPRQGGTKLLSSTESNDSGAKATTMIFQNHHSLQANRAFYQDSLQRNGWTLSRSTVVRGTAVMLFGRSSGSLELAMRRENETTTIFANVRGEQA